MEVFFASVINPFKFNNSSRIVLCIYENFDSNMGTRNVLKNISRRVVGSYLINISSPKCFLLSTGKCHKNC